MAGVFSGWRLLTDWWKLLARLSWYSLQSSASGISWGSRIAMLRVAASLAVRGTRDLYRNDPRLGLPVVVLLGGFTVWVHLPGLLALLAVLLVAAVADQLWRTYEWTTAPTAFVRTLDDSLRQQRSGILTAVYRARPRELDETLHAALKQLFALLRQGLRQFTASLAERLSTSAIVREFVSRFLCCFSVVVAGMGFVYLAAWKVFPSTFLADNKLLAPNWVDALFFSLTTVATSGVSELVPYTVLSKALVSVEQVCGVVLLLLSGACHLEISRGTAPGRHCYSALLRYIPCCRRPHRVRSRRDAQDPVVARTPEGPEEPGEQGRRDAADGRPTGYMAVQHLDYRPIDGPSRNRSPSLPDGPKDLVGR